jgi:drug/metabolite transporter (DMT)-like permease
MLYILIVLLTCFLFALQPVVLKEINISIIYQNLVVAIVVISVASAYLATQKIKNPIFEIFEDANKMKLSIFMCIYSIFSLFGLKLLPVSISIPLAVTSYLFSDIFNKYMNNMNIALGDFLANIVIFIGVIFITYSQTHASRKTMIIGSIFMVISVLSLSLTSVYIKRIDSYKTKLSTMDLTNNEIIYSNAIYLVLSIILSVLYFFNTFNFATLMNNIMGHKKSNMTITSVIKMIVGFFIVKYVANILLLLGFDNLNITIYNALLYMRILFAMILGYYLFKEEMGPRKFIGMALVFLGIGVTLLLSKLKKYEDKNGKHNKIKIN